MHYVYILESVAVPGHFYIGYTDNLRHRLRQHRADVDAHAAKYRPWKLKTYLAFGKKATTVRFESYLQAKSTLRSRTEIFLRNASEFLRISVTLLPESVST